jgi:four helix bundle protein
MDALIKTYEDLRVYQLGFDAAMQIFHLTKQWPREELYSLVDQVRRSSRSVTANIAEGWTKRRYPANFVSKLSDAEAEAAETRNWLKYALACGYIDEATRDALYSNYDQIIGGLVKMEASPDKWCKGPLTVKEERALYG